MVCDSPFWVLPKAAVEKVPVPCGRCPNCKKRRVNGWIFRLQQQDKISHSAHFVTLTYDNDHVPFSDNGFLTLKKIDIQNFFKRLRKLNTSKIKYYLCGEYGSKNKRPHYHMIIFNVDDINYIADAWSLDGVQFGNVDIGKVTSASIAYTLKYIDKSVYRPKHGRDDRVPEFSLMSKGLGINYITNATTQYHTASVERLYLTTTSGHKIAMPRYYRNKIYTETQMQEQVEHIKTVMDSNESKLHQIYVRQYGSNNIFFNFEDWKDQQRIGRYKNFHSSLKSRNL